MMSGASSPDSPEYVYLIAAGDLHKIGWSTDPERRLADVAREVPGVRLVHAFLSDDARLVEGSLHRHFRGCQIKREWFRLLPSDVERLRQLSRVDAIADLPPDLRWEEYPALQPRFLCGHPCSKRKKILTPPLQPAEVHKPEKAPGKRGRPRKS